MEPKHSVIKGLHCIIPIMTQVAQPNIYSLAYDTVAQLCKKTFNLGSFKPKVL